jgi:hypothetical protein
MRWDCLGCRIRITNNEISNNATMTNEEIRMTRVAFIRYSRFHYSLLTLLLAFQGCSSSPIVDLKPVNSHQSLEARFSRAYYAPSESGEDRVVLLSDPIDDPTGTGAGDALSPSTGPPLWQVLYIELHWRSSSPGKADSLVADNAVLHWYVYGKPTGTGMGALHYVGTGSVEVSPDKTGADVTVSKTNLRLLDHHGELRDPFHEFQISTTFHAANDPAHLRQTLSDVDKAIAEADKAGK